MNDRRGVTRRRLLTGTAALGGALLVLSDPGVTAAVPVGAGKGFDTAPAEAALRRLLPRHHRQVALRAMTGAGDRFRVTGTSGRIVVEGTSPAVLLTGVHRYLRDVAHASASWNGEQLNLPRRLPAPTAEITASANVAHRFVFNDTNEGYTGPYRSWESWQRELDVLALHGFNSVLVTVGADAAYYDTFRTFGYSEAELLSWIPAPAHQPWWLLQNMSEFGGPVSRGLLERRADLGRRIADRVRELGMTPVLPGWFGTVPDGFPGKHPGAVVVPQGTWGAFERPDWLDPRTDAFTEVGAEFYARLEGRLGQSSLYKMDLLHEGGQAGDVPVGEAARAVETALQTAHPGAVWVILGWQTNPRRDILDAVDTSRMLIVDGLSDRYATVIDRESDWAGTPYAYGSIWNFGGHTALGANTPDWVETYPAWRDKEGSKLAGIAAMPEGADNNPAALALLTDLAWSPGTLDLDDWFGRWATSRYGGADPHAAAAWQVLRDTAYGMRRADSWSEAPDGLFAARPGLTAGSAASWSPAAERYDTTAFDRALTELLNIAPHLRESSAYRHDLLDVARQVLSNRSRILLPQIKAAYDVGDARLFRQLTKTWLDWMNLLDEALATSPQHLLGRWLADARSWGADGAEKDRLEYDARSILTTWGGRASSDEGLHDYANREWSGLVAGLYRTRWQTYFTELAAALAENRRPADIDWFALDDAWARGHDPYPVRTSGSIQSLARRVRDTLAHGAHQAALAVSARQGAVAEGLPATVEVTFTHRNGFTAAQDVTLSLDLPDGLTAEPDGPVTTTSVASGASFTGRFTVSLTGAARDPVVRVRADAAYRTGRSAGTAVGAVRLMAGTGVQEPYRTVSFNDAVFGQSGEAFAIEGAGADLWGATDEFGAVYRAGAFADGTSASVRITSQDPTGGWARTGLIVRDDLTGSGSAGYVNLAVTPSNGCVLTWDSDGNGSLDSIATAGGSVTAPVHLRLTREGIAYKGEFSTDGSTWTAVGTATPGNAAATQDVGAFMTAANGWTDKRGIVTFDRLRI
ncbi:alpha-N-acetylglucosaminidase [Streptomyces sp. NBC_00316]|uniref:alpha-N-acetylglucosaminidase n=1 Tax=Streptomyces sp. NBC_00316 TaxID=2975710 RepID=UPI002E2D86BD|nr:alpha-N-acetylglucosaminidase TIM-barrel domain-containing protein [Streptomyces sp. NBC_00316]